MKNQTIELLECPSSPNCVSTHTNQEKKLMDSITFKTTPQNVILIIKKTVLSQPRTELINEDNNILKFVFTSKWFRFKDDVLFFIDSELNQIHFKSSSRLGHRDFNANRNRMEHLAKLIIDDLKNEQ